EAEDFMAEPAPKYFRLFPGNEVRLKGAYVVKCTSFHTDEDGRVTEIFAEYDPDSSGGDPKDGRKVKSTIHWVDANTALDAEVRVYDNLFSDPDPDGGDKDFLDCLNPNSLTVLTGCKVEAGLADAAFPQAYQFMRKGYFCVDHRDSAKGHLVFNRSVALKDSFNK
ncbi:MAG: glutamine--tRNA ligase, partial [Bacillota bacterium]